MSNIIAIVGRPNVGKSTLFNRLTESRDAIVKEVSGVTRDRIYGKGEWNGYKFSVIDTGGYAATKEDIFEGEIRKQVELAIDEAKVILFMVDVMTGIVEMDLLVAELLRKSKKKILVVANKVDTNDRIGMSAEFYSFGLGDVFDLSAANGGGTGDLLDDLVKALPEAVEADEETLPRFAVVGRPNAGKSSFINSLIGEDRYIVTDIAGTTRDSIDTRYKRFGFEFNLVDTAGIRKKSKVKEDLEFYSVMRSVRAIEHCDVIILVFDASRGFDGQVQNIFWLAHRNNKGVVILANKWDLIEKDNQSAKDFEKYIKKQCEPYTDVPIVFMSVLNKQRIYKAIETAVEVYQNRTKKIKTSTLNDTMLPIIQHTSPPQYKGKYIKIKYITQLPTPWPSFAFFANLPQYVKEPYKRFLENQLRKEFDFHGVPVTVFIRKK